MDFEESDFIREFKHRIFFFLNRAAMIQSPQKKVEIRKYQTLLREIQDKVLEQYYSSCKQKNKDLISFLHKYSHQLLEIIHVLADENYNAQRDAKRLADELHTLDWLAFCALGNKPHCLARPLSILAGVIGALIGGVLSVPIAMIIYAYDKCQGKNQHEQKSLWYMPIDVILECTAYGYDTVANLKFFNRKSNLQEMNSKAFSPTAVNAIM